MILKNIKRFITATFLLFTLFSVNAQSEKTDYQALFETGSLKDIKKEFSSNNKLFRQRTNSSKDTILMTALKADRDADIINFILSKGTLITWENKQKQDAVQYALKYSTKEKVINSILKKIGNKKKITDRLLTRENSGICCWENALENPEALKIVQTYIPKDSKPTENPQPFITIEESAEDEEMDADTIVEKEDAESQTVENSVPSPAPVPEVKEETKSKTENKTESEKKTDKIEETIKKENKTEPVSEPAAVPAEVKPAPAPVSVPEVKAVSEPVKTDVQSPSPAKSEPEIKEEKKAPVLSEPVSVLQPVMLYDFAPDESARLPEEPDSYELIKIENPDETDSNGRTQLMNAAKKGNLWLVKSLIKSGANVKIRDSEGWTALMYAIRYQNNIEVINTLVQNGAALKDSNGYKTSVLSLASCYSENPEILKKVLNAYKPGDPELFKSFILCITSESTSVITQCEKLELFIKRNLPMNRIHEGRTPLMYACQFGKSTKVIEKLLKNGAIPSIRTAGNMTAFDYAAKNTNLEHNEVYWSLNTGR